MYALSWYVTGAVSSELSDLAGKISKIEGMQVGHLFRSNATLKPKFDSIEVLSQMAKDRECARVALREVAFGSCAKRTVLRAHAYISRAAILFSNCCRNSSNLPLALASCS